MRKNFAQVLKEGNVDISLEYDRIYSLLFDYNSALHMSLYNKIDISFKDVWFRKTAISLADFNKEYGFDFKKKPSNPSIDDLVSFCEYFYNFVITSGIINSGLFNDRTAYYTQHIYNLMERIGYMQTKNEEGLVYFLEKDPTTVSVSELLPAETSYKLLSYNHHSLKGKIKDKKTILRELFDLLEPRKKELASIDNSFKVDLFNAFNNLDLRHNNTTPGSDCYHKYVADMEKTELEKWYDEIYQMCLLAFLRLEQAERKPKFDELMKKVNEKGNA